MERRAFLAMIASAPIAALAPWPAILRRGVAVSDCSVIYGRGFVKIGTGLWEYVPNDPVPVRVLDAWIGWPTKPLEEGMKKLADAIERDYAARHRRFDPARLPT